jgi:hypothetical protein
MPLTRSVVCMETVAVADHCEMNVPAVAVVEAGELCCRTAVPVNIVVVGHSAVAVTVIAVVVIVAVCHMAASPVEAHFFRQLAETFHLSLCPTEESPFRSAYREIAADHCEKAVAAAAADVVVAAVEVVAVAEMPGPFEVF